MISALPVSSHSEVAPQTRTRYDDLSDNQVVGKAQRRDYYAAEYLLYKYRYIVRARVAVYFLIGAEREDLLQVGMIGLWQSIMDYRFDRSASFASFATLCVTRHILTAIKAATRCKQTPLNNAHSLEYRAFGCPDPILRFSDGRPDHRLDPQELILRQEATADLNDKLQSLLSEFEWSVFSSYKLGKTYLEIAADLSCNAKSVDNALGRIKRKLTANTL